jgi:hypothetical protein
MAATVSIILRRETEHGCHCVHYFTPLNKAWLPLRPLFDAVKQSMAVTASIILRR